MLQLVSLSLVFFLPQRWQEEGGSLYWTLMGRSMGHQSMDYELFSLMMWFTQESGSHEPSIF
jgi:hypothetical protein